MTEDYDWQARQWLFLWLNGEKERIAARLLLKASGYAVPARPLLRNVNEGLYGANLRSGSNKSSQLALTTQSLRSICQAL